MKYLYDNAILIYLLNTTIFLFESLWIRYEFILRGCVIHLTLICHYEINEIRYYRISISLLFIVNKIVEKKYNEIRVISTK